jgi:Gly-Xaa carboxypeptidase
MSKHVALIKPLAENFNLSFIAFGVPITNPSLPSFGSLVISNAWGSQLEPAPVTPYTGKESAAYQLLSGTIKSVYNTHRGLVGNDNIQVQPGYQPGNTGKETLSARLFRPYFTVSRYKTLLEIVSKYFPISS